MAEDVHQLIMDEIGKIEGDKKFAGDSVMVCCPFHADGSPSCGIYTAVGMEIPLGSFHCFGCGEKGHWNVLARKVGLAEIKEWRLKDAGENSLSALRTIYDKMGTKIGTYPSLVSLMKALGRPSYMEWPDDVDWRGYPGSLVRAAGGLLNAQRTGTNICFFPCKSGTKYVGGIAAYLSKQFTGTSYVNSQGDWAKEKGLFPLQLVKDLLRTYALNYVVIVEGPRDALALISQGIPALAVLGAEQFGDVKRRSIELLGVHTVYTMTDNDGGGKLLRNNITASFGASNGHIRVLHFKLPREKDDRGKLVKMDPDNAPKEIIKEVRLALKDKHGSKCLIPAKKLGWNRIEKVKQQKRK